MRSYAEPLFMSLGDTCKPASLLRNAGLRGEAYPFDWITGSGNALVNCIRGNFQGFHTQLTFNSPHQDLGMNTVLTDTLGFSFHHDYPTIENSEFRDEWFREMTIVDNWADYYDSVYSKYQRRIERFRLAMHCGRPIICVCHRPISDCIRIREAIRSVYDKKVLIIVNEPSGDVHPGIFSYVHSDSDFTDFNRAVALALRYYKP